jgi:Flp pilus assembly protein TadD
VAREYVDVQQFNADRADGRTNLGTFYAERGDFARAVSELREAIRLDPFFPPAYVNLADVFRAAGSARDAEGEQVLRDGLSRAPTNATLHHALGLALTRLNRHDEALVEFHRATELDPVNARFGYVYAVALHSAGKVKESIAELNRVLKMAPDDPDVLTALASFSGKAP